LARASRLKAPVPVFALHWKQLQSKRNTTPSFGESFVELRPQGQHVLHFHAQPVVAMTRAIQKNLQVLLGIKF